MPDNVRSLQIRPTTATSYIRAAVSAAATTSLLAAPTAGNTWYIDWITLATSGRQAQLQETGEAPVIITNYTVANRPVIFGEFVLETNNGLDLVTDATAGTVWVVGVAWEITPGGP